MTIRLDRSSLVMQVRNDLRSQVADGKIKSGDRLPGEVEAADAYGVSRATIREAFMLLEQEGLVRVRRGHGRYVMPYARQQLTGSVSLFASMTDFLESRGYRVGTRVISVETRPASPDEAATLELQPGTPVVCLTRFRLGNGVPLVYAISIFSAEIADGRADEMEWTGSVMAFMRSKGFEARSAVNDVRAVHLPDGVAEADGIDPCVPWLLLTGTQFDQRDRPFLLSHDFIRGDVRTLRIIQRAES